MPGYIFVRLPLAFERCVGTMPATMTRPNANRPHATALSSTGRRGPRKQAGWTRKTFALALHASCLVLFWALVVSPVVTPILTGELQREFKPLLQAWAGWLGASTPTSRP